MVQTRAEHAAFVDKYNAMALPTLEALGKELCTNRWLCAVIQRVVENDAIGFNGGICVRQDSFKNKHACNLEYNDLVAVVPYLRRLGHTVVLFSDEEQSHPFNVGFQGQPCSYIPHLHEDFLEHINCGEAYPIRMYGTSPAQIRRRGLVKCVPRLLGWLRQARINLADPRRPGAMDKLTAERAAELADTDPPHWDTETAVQNKRKRELVDALHASEADRRKGARWFNVRERGLVLRDNSGRPMTGIPMRIDALAGGWHYVFQRERNYQFLRQTTYEVIVLHHDAFDLGPWSADWNLKRIEWEFARQFEDVEPDDEDEDEDGESE